MKMAKVPSYEDGNPSDWPSNFSEFKELEMILGCGICFEYMSTAMVTKCSHNFCSLCIRRYVCYKQQCPICLDPVFESDLRNNRIVDEIIQHFTKSRSKLLTLMGSNPGLVQGHSSSNSTEIKEARSIPTHGQLSPTKSCTIPNLGNCSAETKVTELDSEKKQKGKSDFLSSFLIFSAGWKKSPSRTNSSASLALSAQNGDSGCIAVDVDSESDVTIDGDSELNPPLQNSSDSDCLFIARQTNSEPDEHQSGPSETRSSRIDSDCYSTGYTGSFSSLPSNSCFELSSPAAKLTAGVLCTTPSGQSSTLFGSGLLSPSTAAVVCPVCNIDVPSRNINLHLDRCLASELKKERPNRHTLKRKPMPKLVYTLLSEKDLRKKLSEVGLPANGNRQVLIKRHHEFTLLYNAQCDSLHPKSVEEIVSEMMQADTLKSVSAVPSTATTNLKLDKTSTAEQVELAQKNYVKKHMSQFKELVKAARRNKEASSECANPSTVVEMTATSADADIASEGVSPVMITEPSIPSTETECNSIEPPVEATSHRSLEIEPNIEEYVSPKTSTSDDFRISRPSHRIRRKLDQCLSGDAHIPLSGMETKESAANSHEMPPVATRRSLRSHACKKKPASTDASSVADNEDADDSQDANINVADDDDDDYEIMPSYSGRKRKAGNNNRLPRPPKTSKPEKVDVEPSSFSL